MQKLFPKTQNLDDLDIDLSLPEELDEESLANLYVKWATDPSSWMKYFFPHYFTKKSPEFHREIIRNFQYLPNTIQAYEAPRGSAKSTLSEFLTFHSAVFNQLRFIMFISKTEEIAADRINTIKFESDNNKLFKLFFHDCRGSEKWGEIEIILRNDRLNIHCKILSRGLGQQVLGIKYLYQRPQLIVVDDPEDIKIAENPSNVDKDERWFSKEVIPALADNGKVFIISTPVTADCLIQRVSRYPNVLFKRFGALTPQGVALWPEWKDAKALAELKSYYAAIGQLYVYYNEYLCEPLDPDRHPFKESLFEFYDLPKKELDEWLSKLNIFILVDLAIGEERKDCFSALQVVGVDSTDTWHLLDEYQVKEDWYEFAKDLYGYRDKWKPLAVGVEAMATQKGFWSVLQLTAEKHGWKPIYATPLKADKDKDTRILRLLPRHKVKKIKYLRNHTKTKEQLILFPDYRFRDLADALAYGEIFCYAPGTTKPDDPILKDSWRYKRGSTDQERKDEERDTTDNMELDLDD